jgi:hypothetical protein
MGLSQNETSVRGGNLLPIISMALLFASAAFGGGVPFQKQKDPKSLGYSIRDSDNKKIFFVTLNLGDASTDASFFDCYLNRAVALECNKRGFKFIDTANSNSNERMAFCYDLPDRKSLGILFDVKELEKPKSRFIIEDLNQKDPTNLKVGDEILLVNGAPLTSLASLKRSIFESKPEVKFKLQVLRAGSKVELAEPLFVLKNSTVLVDETKLKLLCP